MAAIKKYNVVAGIIMRPRKKRLNRERCVTLTFALEGPIPSKKNNTVPLVDFRDADAIASAAFKKRGHLTPGDYNKIKISLKKKGRVVPNSRYIKWASRTKPLIVAQREKWRAVIAAKGLIFPLSNCSLAIYYYRVDTTRRDLGNRLLSIEDMLVDCKVIIDDNDKVLGPIVLDTGNFKGELRKATTLISLTAYY